MLFCQRYSLWSRPPCLKRAACSEQKHLKAFQSDAFKIHRAYGLGTLVSPLCATCKSHCHCHCCVAPLFIIQSLYWHSFCCLGVSVKAMTRACHIHVDSVWFKLICDMGFNARSQALHIPHHFALVRPLGDFWGFIDSPHHWVPCISIRIRRPRFRDVLFEFDWQLLCKFFHIIQQTWKQYVQTLYACKIDKDCSYSLWLLMR